MREGELQTLEAVCGEKVFRRVSMIIDRQKNLRKVHKLLSIAVQRTQRMEGWFSNSPDFVAFVISVVRISCAK